MERKEGKERYVSCFQGVLMQWVLSILIYKQWVNVKYRYPPPQISYWLITWDSIMRI